MNGCIEDSADGLEGASKQKNSLLQMNAAPSGGTYWAALEPSSGRKPTPACFSVQWPKGYFLYPTCLVLAETSGFNLKNSQNTI